MPPRGDGVGAQPAENRALARVQGLGDVPLLDAVALEPEQEQLLPGGFNLW